MTTPEGNYLKQLVWKLYKKPCTGRKSAEEVPLPVNRMGKHNTPKKQKVPWEEGHAVIIEMEEFDVQYDEIDVHFVGPYPDMASDLDEIMIDDIKKSSKTEAYTIRHLPADCDGKTNASIWLKINTGAGGNVMPLRVFERLYPKQMNLNGEPTGMETSTTKLTAYNGM